MGYLTLRLRGTFFSIATLAMAVVAQTLITNWDFVGGSRGAYIVRPADSPIFRRRLHPVPVRGSCWFCRSSLSAVARAIQLSRLGYGFSAIRDDELAAEASGVPTLRLKLIATVLSGGLHGHGRRTAALLRDLSRPRLGFSLSYAVNTIAMPLIGGTSTWLGPVIGAVLLGTLQQVATVTISSALSLLLVGVLLVGFVIAAPRGHRWAGSGDELTRC